MLIKHWSDSLASDRYLIYIDPRAFTILKDIHKHSDDQVTSAM